MGTAESIYGLAYGDAVGKPTEFMTMASIRRVFGKRGIQNMPVDGKVTDDTQMALEVGEALIEVGTQLVTYETLAPVLVRRFVEWCDYTDGTRAPGTACMVACRKMKRGIDWWEATDVNSKGCGANMRVTFVGLASWLTAEQRSGVAQLQAALTHAHPTALAAADATQQAVYLLNTGTAPENLLDELIAYCEDRSAVYHDAWLGELWAWSEHRTPLSYVRAGWNEVIASLLDVVNATYRPNWALDPCLQTGAGWIAEEALATALHCFLLYPDSGRQAVLRAANTSGDSDSIAALTGAFAGAYLGIGAFPVEWNNRIEYRRRLARLIKNFV